MKVIILLAGVAVLALIGCLEAAKQDDVLLATWNIQNFGSSKVADPQKMKTIIKTIEMLDILAIQEISDIKGLAMGKLMSQLSKKKKFKVLLSPRVGEGGFAEQYGIIYNADRFLVSTVGIYNESTLFRRPPFFVTVKSLVPGNPIKFGLGTIHTSPPEAVEETSNLAAAADWYTSLTGQKNVMLVGDYNCGCNYVRDKDYGQIKLYTDPQFRWLVPSCFDTTVATSTDCPYDRIVIRGESLFEAIVPESTKVFDFGKKYKLNEKEALAVSDHFPVLLELKQKSSNSNA